MKTTISNKSFYRSAIFVCALFLAFACFTFTACGDDEEGSGNSSGVVGTWIDNDDRIYTFRSNGTGTESEPDYYGSDGERTQWDITYTYDEEKHTLVIYDEEGLDQVFYDVRVSKDYIVATNEDWYGGSVTLERVK